MSNKKAFQLRAEEAEYVSTLMSKDSAFRELLSKRSEVCIGRNELTLDQDEAELLRDYFTERLARVGLDERYELTQKA